ncbi:hypothetical protein B0H34DRAFT_298981 [Crassisporium funariophilum]|nr:hypothetical protein B0H34DRAFT_298981 [Crassisporium funariophilum]
MHAPQPFLAALRNRDSATIRLMSPPPMHAELSLRTSHERLRSPIHLEESTSDLSWCAPSSRRRPRAAAQSTRRRRLSPRAERIPTAPSHAFDELPWISSLESASDMLNPWDIADLSLIPDSSLTDLSASGPGPVRRRKTSLRSNPVASSTKNNSPGSHFPIRDTSLLASPSVPTPRSRFTPSRVLFQNLMPVLSCDSVERPAQSCINSSRINF